LIAAASAQLDKSDPLAVSLDAFTRDLNVNTTSVFAAAQQAVQAFKELPESASRTFIYTGNILNEVPMVALMDNGIGKTATAHLLQIAAQTYADKGYK